MADCRQVAAGQSPWLTVKQAAARLGVSDDCVYDRVRERRLTSRREGRRVLIAADSLSAYERATTTPALPRIGAAIPTTNRPSASGLSEAEEALWGRKEGGHLTAAGDESEADKEEGSISG